MRAMRNSVTCLAIILGAIGCSDGGLQKPGALEFPEFGDIQTFSDHREIPVRFQSEGNILSGTLYVPAAGTDFPTAALNEGSGWDVRSEWDVLSGFVLGLQVGILGYDKRGSGASQGSLPTDEQEYYAALANDLAAAARAAAVAPLVRADRVGVIGTSQGGWVTPLAANLDRQTIRFTISIVGGAVSTGQDAIYDELTGYSRCVRSGRSIEEIIQALRDAGPSRFDPRASLEALTQPTIWIYGGQDFSHSAAYSAELLAEVEAVQDKDWTIVILENANHEMIEGGTICGAEGQPADVGTPLLAWLEVVFD